MPCRVSNHDDRGDRLQRNFLGGGKSCGNHTLFPELFTIVDCVTGVSVVPLSKCALLQPHIFHHQLTHSHLQSPS